MPKNKVKTKNESGAIITTRAKVKFRIGSRKGGKSAVKMTDDELLKVLEDSSKSRYHSNARIVLRNRGVVLNAPFVNEAKTLADVAEEFKN